jgi:hypothetical protein
VASRISAGTGYLPTSPIEIGEHRWQDTVLGVLRALLAQCAACNAASGLQLSADPQWRVIAWPFDRHIVVRPDW